MFDQAPANLALTTKMVEVAENYNLDVLHVHYAMPFAASAYLARQLMLPRQLGVVTTLHGTDITVVGVEPAFFRVTQFSIQSSDRVTAVSRFLKRARRSDIRHHAAHRGDLQLRRPRRVRAAAPERAAPRGARHESSDARFQLPSGQEHTGGDSCVRRSAQAHARRSWSWSGDGPEKAGAEHLARELGVERDVLFLGNQDCMEELLPLADVFLLPSSSESFGLVALEAMSAEVPVVCFQRGWVARGGRARRDRLPARSRNTSPVRSQSVLKLLTNEPLRRTMGRRAPA